MSSPFIPVMPNCLEVELGLLGALLFAPGRISEVDLSVDDLYGSLNRKVLGAMRELEAEGTPIDSLTLNAELAGDTELHDAGGVGWLESLTIGHYKLENIQAYCRLIKEDSAKRKLQRTATSALAAIANGEQLVDVQSNMASELESIRDGGSVGEAPVHISNMIDEFVQKLESGRGKMSGNPTGFEDLDKVTCGWHAGNLGVLAARPSMGKTSLACESTLRQTRAGNPVGFFSLEMTKEEILDRLVCIGAKVDSQRFRDGKSLPEELDRIYAALSRIKQMPLWISDPARMTVTELRYKIRAIAKSQKTKLVVVDYLQLLKANGKDRFEEVTNVSLELKAAARELGKISGGTLFALSQLSRAAAGETPRLEHLRESGQIEQDADVVLLLYNAEEAENGQQQPITKIVNVAKQRNGPCEPVRLMFVPNYAGFVGVFDPDGFSREKIR